MSVGVAIGLSKVRVKLVIVGNMYMFYIPIPTQFVH